MSDLFYGEHRIEGYVRVNIVFHRNGWRLETNTFDGRSLDGLAEIAECAAGDSCAHCATPGGRVELARAKATSLPTAAGVHRMLSDWAECPF